MGILRRPGQCVETGEDANEWPAGEGGCKRESKPEPNRGWMDDGSMYLLFDDFGAENLKQIGRAHV